MKKTNKIDLQQPMKKTKKKKNTYVVKISSINELFALASETPLPIITLNGQPVTDNSGWIKCESFPNPAAHNMVASFPKLEPIMGEKLASTIIEYLDKDSNAPVAMLFPTNELIYRADLKNFLSRMNAASRQDLKRQMQIRERILQQLIEKQK